MRDSKIVNGVEACPVVNATTTFNAPSFTGTPMRYLIPVLGKTRRNVIAVSDSVPQELISAGGRDNKCDVAKAMAAKSTMYAAKYRSRSCENPVDTILLF